MSAPVVNLSDLGPLVTATLLLATGPAAAILVAAMNWSAAIPWRRHRHEHWAEQARRLFPVVVAAQTMPWLVPLSLVLGVLLLDPGVSRWLLVGLGLAGCAGAMAGDLPGNREAFPRVGWRELIRQTVLGFLLRFLLVFVLVGAMAAMPPVFDRRVLALTGALLALHLYWSHSGWRHVGARIGLVAPAPERLRRIVDGVVASTGVACRGVWVLRASSCQAFAMPLSRELLFSERLLAVMPDEEIAAICAHELAHFTESRGVLVVRVAGSLALLPWIFVVPLLHTLGPLGVYVPVLLMVAIPTATAAMIRRLEVRADAAAAAQEEAGGVYARALLRLSEDNLATVVFPGKRATHPHTYDRVVAAGITPDFPRPCPPASMAWHGTLFSFLVGAEIALLAIRSLR